MSRLKGVTDKLINWDLFEQFISGLNQVLLVSLALIVSRGTQIYFKSNFYESVINDTLGYAQTAVGIAGYSFMQTRVILAFVVVLGVFLWLWRSTSWKTLDSRLLKFFLLFCVFLLTWRGGTYSYNYLFDQAFMIDRLLLVLLAGLSFYHPAGILLFLVEYYLFLSQFHLEIYYASPLINAHFPLLVLFVFISYLLISSTFRLKSSFLILLILISIGGNYYHAGIQKYFLSPSWFGWPLNFRLDFIFAKFFFRGWGKSFFASHFNLICTYLSLFSIALVTPIFILELSGVLSTARRWIAIIVLTGLGVFHFLLFSLSGLFYWMWAIVDFALVILLLRLPEKQVIRVFNRKNLIVGFIVMITFTYSGIIQTRSYGWWNVRYVYGFYFSAENHDGKTYRLKADNWSPYHPYFWGGFEALAGYLLKEKRLPDSTANYEVSRTLNKLLISRPDHLDQFKKRFGVNHYDEAISSKFVTFIRKSAKNRLSVDTPFVNFLMFFSPPQFFWSDPFAETYFLDEVPGELKEIRVIFKEGIYTGDGFSNTNKKIMKRIKPFAEL